MELGLNVFNIYLKSIRQKNFEIRKKNKKKLKKKNRERKREREKERGKGTNVQKIAFGHIIIFYYSIYHQIPPKDEEQA